MKKWQNTLSEMRAEAIAKTDHKEAAKSFDEVLTGYNAESIEGGRFAITPTLEKAAQIKTGQAHRICNGWSLILNRYVDKSGVHWHFSAMLYPRGRSSSEKDWRWLGTMARFLGAPETPMERQFVEAEGLQPANRPVHWNWKEETN